MVCQVSVSLTITILQINAVDKHETSSYVHKFIITFTHNLPISLIFKIFHSAYPYSKV